ncbi:DUF397 domain-containing protein [Streptomyces coelicoflavus]|uniref:DUF397 domain-containing protein n=1 Tax=Streptomyces coelicoflavus TaxID=285562 RepID=UPI0036CFCF44
MNWRKSTYSGGGEGNTCVEIAESVTHISIRDSKAPACGTLSVAVSSFAAFVEGTKRHSRG